MKFPLRQVAEALGLTADSDATAKGWSIDSRTVQPGDLFFALRGPNFDGHDYVAQVLEKGAVAAVVEKDVKGRGIALRVEDSVKALQKLAEWARERWGGDVVAVTGSAGKTTTKEVIAEMLATKMRVAKSAGNLNNHIGLPLSILRLDENSKVAVIEIGMNHAGEIRDLAQIARPQVGVVTNVGYAHIENFDSIEGIAAAKRELIEALPPSGAAVLNAEDPRVKAFPFNGKRVLYGNAEDVEYLLDGAKFRIGSTRFETKLAGRHNVSNILAGIAVAGLYGIGPEQLKETVAQLRPGKMRGERFEHCGVIVYNDCYNSNPDAARAMIDVLRDTPAQRRIAVLGEMLELGKWSERLHREIGEYAAASGIDFVFGIAGAAKEMPGATFFDDPGAAGHAVRELARPGDAILFKGSRGVHVEHALEVFLEGSRN